MSSCDGHFCHPVQALLPRCAAAIPSVGLSLSLSACPFLSVRLSLSLHLPPLSDPFSVSQCDCRARALCPSPEVLREGGVHVAPLGLSRFHLPWCHEPGDLFTQTNRSTSHRDRTRRENAWYMIIPEEECIYDHTAHDRNVCHQDNAEPRPRGVDWAERCLCPMHVPRSDDSLSTPPSPFPTCSACESAKACNPGPRSVSPLANTIFWRSPAPYPACPLCSVPTPSRGALHFRRPGP